MALTPLFFNIFLQMGDEQQKVGKTPTARIEKNTTNTFIPHPIPRDTHILNIFLVTGTKRGESKQTNEAVINRNEYLW